LTTSSRRKFRTTLLIVLGAFLATHLLFGLLPNVFEVWNAQTIDQLFVLRGSKKSLRPAYDSTIAHVDLNNTTIERLESHYLNRSHFARVVENLAAMEVSAQLYDFIFAARLDEESDRRFMDAVKEAKNVYFGLAFRLVTGEPGWPGQGASVAASGPISREVWHPIVEGDPQGFYVGTNPLSSFKDLSLVAKGLGSLSVRFDRDGVLRRVPLLVRYGDGFCPFLAFRVACDYLGMTPDRIVVQPGRHIILKDAEKPGETRPHDISIPIDRHGNMIVNYIGPWGRMDHYNFADILLASDDRFELSMWRDELRGRIVVVSDASTGSTDVGPVPTDPYFPLGGVHANIAHTILTESFLTVLSEPLTNAMEALMLLAVLVLSLRFSSLYFSIGTGFLLAFFVAIVCVSFLYASVVIHMVRPVMMVTLALTTILIYRYITEEKEKLEGLRQRDFIRSTFGRYLSNEVVEELLGSPGGLTMSGEIREVTFLVSDLRGFTSFSSRLTPHEVIVILNRYFEHMIEIIGKYRGTVSEFRGDGMLIFFGAPLASSDDAERAVACAIHMQNALLDINKEQRGQNLPELGMGIGIHTGDVVVGNIGCEKRASYGAVGSPINTAFRIESYTVGGQTLISPVTYERVKSLVSVRDKINVAFKGLEGRMTLYDVDAIAGSYNLSLIQRVAASLVGMDPPIPVRCHVVEGKTVSDRAFPAKIVGLSETRAEALLQGEVDNLSNVKLSFDSTDGHVSDVYAKVLSHEGGESESQTARVLLEFTFLAEDAKNYLVGRLNRMKDWDQ
jgi:adenylate cyclase